MDDKVNALLERIAIALETMALINAYPPVVFNSAPPLSPPSPPAPDANPTPASAAPVAAAIPYDTIRLAILSYSDTKGAAAAEMVLKRFGAKYIKDLKAAPERYGEVLEALK